MDMTILIGRALNCRTSQAYWGNFDRVDCPRLKYQTRHRKAERNLHDVQEVLTEEMSVWRPQTTLGKLTGPEDREQAIIDLQEEA